MMEEEQDQLSYMTEDDQEDVLVEDASSETDESSDPRPENDDRFKGFTGNGMIRVGEETSDFDAVKRSFLSGMKQYAKDTEVVALHEMPASSLAVQARYVAFRAYEGVVLKKKGEGVANIWRGWYSGSKEEISQIISHGFSRGNGQLHGVGVYLSPTKFLLEGLASSTADENGIRHMLFCRVLMGKMEVIPAGSKQTYPSSVEFDSGVDNLEAPRRLVVWSAFMNSHIFPTHILSFKAPSFNCLLGNQVRELKKHGPFSLPATLSLLVKFLGPAKRVLIAKIFGEFHKRKTTRSQLVQSVRRVVGDDQMLIDIIKSNRAKLVVRGLRRTCGAQEAACRRGRMF